MRPLCRQVLQPRTTRFTYSTFSHSIFTRTALAAFIAASVNYQALAAEENGALELEEIIVTSTKSARDEALSDVAETINVLTSEKLQNYNIFSFSDLETLTPGLSLKNFDARNSGISLRGTPYDPDSAASETVVSYWNGIPVRANVAFNQLFDIAQIEILRGAQGTLQGNTSPSGSIQLYTKRGNENAYEFNAQQTFDDNETAVTEMAGSVPLIEGKLGMRVAAVVSDAGLYEQTAIYNDLTASSNSRAGRVNFNWLASDDFNVLLTQEYLERKTDGLESVEGSDQVFAGNPSPIESYERISLQEGEGDIQQRNELTALEANWTTHGHILTSLTGYQDIKNYALRDLDIGNIFPNFEENQLVDSAFEIWNQELRITNEDPKFWEYIIGSYYGKSTSFTYNTNVTPVFWFPTVNSPLSPFAVNESESFIPVQREDFAVFADNKFFLTDATTLQVGLRWQKTRGYRAVDTYALKDLAIAGISKGDLIAVGIAEDNKRTNANTWTGSVKLAHDMNEDTTVYTSLSRSYRPEGISISPTPGVAEDLLLYDEEFSNNLELGFKSRLEEGRYQVNGAVYYQEFSDFQNRSSNLFLDITGDGTLETPILGGINYNADAVIRGAEFEATALITADWLVFVGTSYNDSKFEDGLVPCGNAGDLATDGQAKLCPTEGRLAPEPNWSVSASSEYTIPEISNGLDGYIRTLYKFTDNRVDDNAAVNTNLYDKYELGGYGTWDLYVGLRSKTSKGNWDVSLWVRNLFDKEAKNDIGYEEVINNRGTNALSRSGYSTVSIIPEQTLGITAKYNFAEF